MHYGIMTSSGNVLEWFEDELSGRNALEEMVQEQPDAAPQLALLSFDDSGRPTGEAFCVGATFRVDDSPWLRNGVGGSSAAPVPASTYREPVTA